MHVFFFQIILIILAKTYSKYEYSATENSKRVLAGPHFVSPALLENPCTCAPLFFNTIKNQCEPNALKNVFKLKTQNARKQFQTIIINSNDHTIWCNNPEIAASESGQRRVKPITAWVFFEFRTKIHFLYVKYSLFYFINMGNFYKLKMCCIPKNKL